MALAEMAINAEGGERGCEVNVPAYPDPVARELFLFGETNGCAWVVVDADQLALFLALAQELGCMARHCGRVGGPSLTVTDAHTIAMLDMPIGEAKAAWQGGFASSVGLTPVPQGV